MRGRGDMENDGRNLALLRITSCEDDLTEEATMMGKKIKEGKEHVGS